MERLIVAAIIFAYQAPANADCINESSNRVSCTGAVKTLWRDDQGRTKFILNGVASSATNCAAGEYNPGGNWIIQNNNPNLSAWYSILLASSVAGNELHVVSNSAVGGVCTIERIELRS